MSEQRVNGHTVSRLTVHIVWSTKYRYPVLQGDVQRECRALLWTCNKKLDFNLNDLATSFWLFISKLQFPFS